MSDDVFVDFPGLSFPGRTSITAREVAKVSECSLEHVGNLCRQGAMKGKLEGKGRNNFRIKLQDWRAFLMERRTPGYNSRAAKATAEQGTGALPAPSRRRERGSAAAVLQ
jgi:hypothetical protein